MLQQLRVPIAQGLRWNLPGRFRREIAVAKAATAATAMQDSKTASAMVGPCAKLAPDKAPGSPASALDAGDNVAVMPRPTAVSKEASKLGTLPLNATDSRRKDLRGWRSWGWSSTNRGHALDRFLSGSTYRNSSGGNWQQ